jgi:hypothetical protein
MPCCRRGAGRSDYNAFGRECLSSGCVGKFGDSSEGVSPGARKIVHLANLFPCGFRSVILLISGLVSLARSIWVGMPLGDFLFVFGAPLSRRPVLQILSCRCPSPVCVFCAVADTSFSSLLYDCPDQNPRQLSVQAIPIAHVVGFTVRLRWQLAEGIHVWTRSRLALCLGMNRPVVRRDSRDSNE